MTTPTPQQAEELLSQVESAQTQARSSDAWPIVFVFFSLSTAYSLALVAIGILQNDNLTAIMTIAATAWLVPAFAVYLVKARSWSKRSTKLVLAWVPLMVILYLAGTMANAFVPGSWIPFITAGLIWIIAPVMALFGLRR